MMIQIEIIMKMLRASRSRKKLFKILRITSKV